MKMYCKKCGWIEISKNSKRLEGYKSGAIPIKVFRVLELRLHRKHVHTNYDALKRELKDLLRFKGLSAKKADYGTKLIIHALLDCNEYDLENRVNTLKQILRGAR